MVFFFIPVTFVIGYNFAMIIVWMTSRFSRCFGRNYLLENEVPTKFQILSHPGDTCPNYLLHKYFVTFGSILDFQKFQLVFLPRSNSKSKSGTTTTNYGFSKWGDCRIL